MKHHGKKRSRGVSGLEREAEREELRKIRARRAFGYAGRIHARLPERLQRARPAARETNIRGLRRAIRARMRPGNLRERCAGIGGGRERGSEKQDACETKRRCVTHGDYFVPARKLPTASAVRRARL